MREAIRSREIAVVTSVDYIPLQDNLALYRITQSELRDGQKSLNTSVREGLAYVEELEIFCDKGGPMPMPLSQFKLVHPNFLTFVRDYGYFEAETFMREKGLEHPRADQLYEELVINGYPLDLLVLITDSGKVFNLKGEQLAPAPSSSNH